jgi:hypothetical protein
MKLWSSELSFVLFFCFCFCFFLDAAVVVIVSVFFQEFCDEAKVVIFHKKMQQMWRSSIRKI